MINHRITLTALVLFVGLTSLNCGIPSPGADAGAGGGSAIGGGPYRAVSGVAQKGPLQLGSLVTVQELDEQLSPTGSSYTYQIDSDLGTFSPTSVFARRYLNLNATGYYYDEVTNTVSSGPLTLNGIADMESDSILNVNLLTTLAYKRIKFLVTTQNMTVAAARAQAEVEVLAALNIHLGSSFGNFGSLDIAGGTDGSNMLAAISSIFVYGNNAGDLSSLVSGFQSNIATNGTITTLAIKSTLMSAARSLNPTTVAANLSAKYALSGSAFTAVNISDWIDQDGDGVVGRFKFSVANATPASTFTIPAAVVTQYSGLPVAVSAGQLSVNGVAATGVVTLSNGDTIALSPVAAAFPAGVFTVYLKTGSTNLARVDFIKGIASIAIAPDNASVAKGLTRQLIATGTFTDSSTADISDISTWTSNATSVIALSSTGLATGLTIGSSTITAEYQGIIGSTSLTVGPAALQSISVTPVNASICKSLTQQFVATGTFTDSSATDISSLSTWTSNATSVISLSSTGLATGLAIGSSTINAEYRGIMGSTSLAVLPVVAWGDNSAGQTTIPAGLSGVTAIAAGSMHTVALKNDGTVVAWGSRWALGGNMDGGQTTTMPTAVTAIAAGGMHAVALKNDGTVVAWGDNSNGQTTIPAGLSGVTAIAAGSWFTVALKNDGTVVAWGQNYGSGQTTIPAGLTGVTAIAGGAYHAVALKSDGTVVAWGQNATGETTIPAGLTGVTAIAAGDSFSMALKNDGTVVAWGDGRLGQTTIPAGLTGVIAIAAGATSSHAVALKNDGTVVAWGQNVSGPTTIPAGLTGVTAIAAGQGHTVALVP